MQFPTISYDNYIDLLKSKSELLILGGKYQHALDDINKLLFATENADFINKNPLAEKANAFVSFGTVYRLCGEYEKSINESRRAIDMIESAGENIARGDAVDINGKALNNLGIICQNVGKYNEALGHFQKYYDLAKAVGDEAGCGRACGNMGSVYFGQGLYDEAIKHYTLAMDIADQTGNKRAKGVASGNLGNAYFVKGDLEKALELHLKDMEIALEIGNKRETGIAAGNIANVFYVKSDYKGALEYYGKYSNIAGEIGDKFGAAMAGGNLGAVYKDLGIINKARKSYSRALELFLSLADKQGMGYCRTNIGALCLEFDDIAGAEEYLNQAETDLIEIGDKSTLIETYWAMAELALKKKSVSEKSDRAEDFGNRAMSLSLEIGSDLGKAGSLLVLGTIDHLQGNYNSAKEKLEEALKLYERLGQKKRLAEAYKKLGQVLYALGNGSEATKCGKSAETILKSIGIG
jgi:tetratricopeptide (TPR) repeat protein